MEPTDRSNPDRPQPSSGDFLLIDRLEAHVQAHPDDSRAWRDLGRLLFRPFHQPKLARDAFEKAYTCAKPGSKEAVDADYWLALCLYLDFDFDDNTQATFLLARALKAAPERAECLLLMAMIRLEADRPFEEVLTLLSDAVTAAPDWIKPRLLFAEGLLAIDHYDKAEQETMAALSYLRRTPTPPDSLRGFFEREVTGRTDPGAEKELFDLLGRIRRERLK